MRRLDAGDRIGTSANVSQRLAHYFRCWPLAALDRFGEARAVADAGVASATEDRQNWALHIFETWRGLQELQAGRLPEAAAALEGSFADPDITETGIELDGKLAALLDYLGVAVPNELLSR